MIMWVHWRGEGGLPNVTLFSFVWDRDCQRRNWMQSLYKTSSPLFPSFLFSLLFSPPIPSHFSASLPPSLFHLSLHLWRPWIFRLKPPTTWSHRLLWCPKLFWQGKVTLTSVLRANLWVKITTAYHLAKLFQISLSA